MLLKLVAVSIVFGLILADPLPKMSSSPSALARSSFSYGNDYSSSYNVLDDSLSLAELLDQPEHTSLIARAISSLIGYKTSALSLAVSAIGWVISHGFVIILGAVATLGFCKITGKCSLDYEAYEPLTTFRSMMTKERLATAERFLIKAIDKYADQRKRSIEDVKE